MPRLLAALTAAALLGAAVPVSAEVVKRASTPAGSVIARKSGEQVLLIDLPPWRTVDVHQDLLPGDILRTNATGNLAVLFSDNTQIRMARNTTLVVKQVGGAADSVFKLESGEIWARAERGGEGLTIETPAAAAAIRGTDWSMKVEGDKTSLVVLEGLVQFSNAQGSVDVAQGEGAVATIGQAPAKVIIVNSDDREQMLFYLSLRNSFGWMPASPLASPQMRGERARIGQIPEAARSAEDWLTLAEVSVSYDGRQAAVAAAQQARQFRLTASQKARLDLLDALAAGAAHNYAEAARLFARAAGGGLDPTRRAVALYGAYFARSLADPERVENPPVVTDGGPQGALVEAWTAGFLKDIPAAIEVIRKAEQRYPDDPTLPAVRAQLAMLLDDRAQMKSAIERSLQLDPDDPVALEARADYSASIEGRLDDALADVERAIAIAPGSATAWNALGLLHSARNAGREAEAAFEKAIELDPSDPVSYANLAILYLDQDRVDEAKAMIDKALSVDPSFDIGLVARGRYHLQTGEMDKAMQDLLAGSTANPAYAQGLLMLAGGYYESGQKEPAQQALDNADRLDPNDPVISSFETAIAIDGYDSDRAIESAQETLRRSRARGGDYASISANREAGSLLNEAFRLQGLDAWGRYYGDLSFDPFAAAGYVDQALAGSVDSFALDLGHGSLLADPEANNGSFSSFFQGLMLDPLMLSGRSRAANLFRRPFVEGSVGGGFVNNGTDDWGWNTEGEIQGYQQSPIPWSFYGKVDADRSGDFRQGFSDGTPNPTSQFDLAYENVVGTGYIAAKPTPNDRVVAYVDGRRNEPDLRDGALLFVPPVAFPVGPFEAALFGSTFDRQVDDRTITAGVGWSHTFGYRNVANAAVFATGFNRKSNEEGVLLLDLEGIPLAAQQTIETESSQQAYIGAVNHIYGIGDLTLRYGAEGGVTKSDSTVVSTTELLTPRVPLASSSETTDLDLTLGRAYLDALYEVTPDLKLEAAAFGTRLDGDGVSINRFEPRIGAAWMPVEGQWLRAGFMRESAPLTNATLSPIGVLGLQSNQAPLDADGYSDTFLARWDAQWGSRVFTTVDYQHQKLNGIGLLAPATIDAVPLTDGTLDRVSATANVWLGHGFGAFGTIAHLDSENRTAGANGPLPFIPEMVGRAGLTWVNTNNLKVTVAATYVGERDGDVYGEKLDSYWTADAFLTWEPFDKRFELDLSAYNLFDEEFYVAPAVPGWGRSFVGTLKVRF